MNEIYLNPYINFQGKAREAMEFYQQALGGELVLLAAGEGGAPHPAGPNEPIMHAHLKSDSAVLMGSDGSPDYPPTVGDNVAITLAGYDHQRMQACFDKLSAGGFIKQALKEESWGTYGFLQDKFGINWIVNVYKPE